MNVTDAKALHGNPQVTEKAQASSFSGVYEKHFSAVYNYVRYQVHDPHLTDDLVSIAFERAFAALATYEPRRGSMTDWLFGIVRNTVRDHARVTRRRPTVSLELVCPPVSPLPSPEQAVIDRETMERLLASVGRLNERERDIIGLKFAAGLSNRSIARLCHLREGNVAIILFRALRRLRQELSDGEVAS